MLLSLLQLTVVSIFNPAFATVLLFRNEDITTDAGHLLFLVGANPVVLNMPVHVLT